MQKDTFTQNKIIDQVQIVEAIKNNDQSVLKSLYIKNYNKVEYLIINNNGSVAQAKDIFQEAYITVWKNVKNNSFTPKNETAINGYIFTIAKNKWMDYLRSSEYKKKISLHTMKHLNNKDDNLNIPQKENEFEQKLSIAMNAFKGLGAPCKNLLTKFYV